MSRDLVGHFEWHHPVNRGDTESLEFRETEKNTSKSIIKSVTADALAPFGVRTPASTVMVIVGSRMYTRQVLKGLNLFYPGLFCIYMYTFFVSLNATGTVTVYIRDGTFLSWTKNSWTMENTIL